MVGSPFACAYRAYRDRTGSPSALKVTMRLTVSEVIIRVPLARVQRPPTIVALAQAPRQAVSRAPTQERGTTSSYVGLERASDPLSSPTIPVARTRAPTSRPGMRLRP